MLDELTSWSLVWTIKEETGEVSKGDQVNTFTSQTEQESVPDENLYILCELGVCCHNTWRESSVPQSASA